MQPTVWGPYFWTTLHVVALGYPDNPGPLERQVYKEFYANFGNVIPCQRCSVNYNRHLDEMPIDGYLGSRNSLFEWTVRFHNIVNGELGKPLMPLERAWDMYLGLHKLKIEQQDNKVWMMMLVMLNVLVVAFIFWKLRKNLFS